MNRRLHLFLTAALALPAVSCYSLARPALGLPPFTTSFDRSETIMVPMKDGVKLKTDIYFPEGKGPWPVILIRNPYNFPGGFGPVAKLFSYYGYVAIHQLARGRAESEGEWTPFFNERADGLATLAWINNQPWQNGSVGLWGASYLSMVQWAMADALPPSVKAMVPMVWGGDMRSVAYQGGMFRYEVVMAWAALMHDSSMDSLNMGNYHKAVAHRPAIEDDEKFLGGKLPWLRDWMLSADTRARIWQLETTKQLQAAPERTKVPVLMVSGWYDIFTASQLADFKRLASRSQSRLIVGPWTHLTGMAGDGDIKFAGAPGGAELMARTLNWFDHHLKGAPLDDWGPVETYAIQGGWHRWPEWPAATSPSRLYFHDLPRANACEGASLENERTAETESVSYIYDPENPTPSRGGSGLLAFALPGWGGIAPSTRDQAGLCERPDVLTWTSAPLHSPAHLQGTLKIALTVSTTADDTAFAAKVIDVAPDGKAVNIHDAISALSYRNNAPSPLTYTPGEKVGLVLETAPIEWIVPAGHRIRVDVSSSNYPAYHAHSNYAGIWALQAKTRKAQQTLYFGPGVPSYVELPVYRD